MAVLVAIILALSVAFSEQCGRPNFATRVIAGVTANRGSWPWQILLIQNRRPMCGGSIVNPTTIVTAAHCIYGSEGKPWSFMVRVGEHNMRAREGSEVDYQVARVIRHRQYNPRSLDFDIAILKLSRPIQMNRYVQPVCLASRELRSGGNCYITGWGKTRHPGSMTTILQQGKMPIVDRATCSRAHRGARLPPVTGRMICSGHGGATRVSGCHGDSGGPFVCQVGGRWELHGAVSHGSGDCSASRSYTVYANIAYFKGWIMSQMG